MINTPVLHVNGDHPEDVVRAMAIAFRYREYFRKVWCCWFLLKDGSVNGGLRRVGYHCGSFGVSQMVSCFRLSISVTR